MGDKNDNEIANNTTYDKKSGGDLYHISWLGSTSSLLANVQKLRRNNILCDCKLVASGRTFFAHKVVLSAASSLLKSLLQEEKSEQSTIILAGVSADDLAALLEYIYHGLVKVDLKQMSALLMIAQCLGISSLRTYQVKADGEMHATLTNQETIYRIETEVEPITSNMLDQAESPKATLESNSSTPINEKRSSSPMVGKMVSHKRAYYPSELPAMCPYCHVVIKQRRNMTRHLIIKHNVIVETKKTVKTSKARDQTNGLPDALQMLQTIAREETVSSTEVDCKETK